MRVTAKQKYSIDDKISYFARRIELVRKSRMHASERLYGYANHWEFIILIMNVISSGLMILSLATNESREKIIISACFSIYTMIMQFYYSTLNYRERALRLHYHQLELEDLNLELEMTQIVNSSRDGKQEWIEEKFRIYSEVVSKYQLALQDQENHAPEDFRKATNYIKKLSTETVPEEKEPLGIRVLDFLGYGDLDTLAIRLQYGILSAVVYLYFVI